MSIHATHEAKAEVKAEIAYCEAQIARLTAELALIEAGLQD